MRDVLGGDDGNGLQGLRAGLRKACCRDDDSIVLGIAEADERAGDDTSDEAQHVEPFWRRPRRPKWLRKGFQAGLRTRERFTAHLPAPRGAVVVLERFFSLTVAGAVEALHLVPVHLAASAMVMRDPVMRELAARS